MSTDTGTTAGSSIRRPDLYRRALDVSISALLIVLTLPVVVVVALGSALALRSWPLFAQDRIGRGGAPFRFVKIRTLPTAVPRYLDKHQLGQFRVPALCRLLRAFHLDELPQLHLVLLGRMSLVGPRPEMAHLHQGMPEPFAEERTQVRPGCTGLWQISEACSGLISDAPEYDRFYLEHRSLRLDLWILYRTALKMAGIGSTVTLQQVPAWALPGDAAEVTVLDLDLEASEASTLPSMAAAGR